MSPIIIMGLSVGNLQTYVKHTHAHTLHYITYIRTYKYNYAIYLDVATTSRTSSVEQTHQHGSQATPHGISKSRHVYHLAYNIMLLGKWHPCHSTVKVSTPAKQLVNRYIFFHEGATFLRLVVDSSRSPAGLGNQ